MAQSRWGLRCSLIGVPIIGQSGIELRTDATRSPPVAAVCHCVPEVSDETVVHSLDAAVTVKPFCDLTDAFDCVEARE